MALDYTGLDNAGGSLTNIDGNEKSGLAGTGGGMSPFGIEQPSTIKKPEEGPTSSKKTGEVVTGNAPSESW